VVVFHNMAWVREVICVVALYLSSHFISNTIQYKTSVPNYIWHTINNFSPCVVDNIFYLCYNTHRHSNGWRFWGWLLMMCYIVFWWNILLLLTVQSSSCFDYYTSLLIYVLGLGYHNSPFAVLVVMETNSRHQDHTCYRLDSPSTSCFWFCSKFLGLLWWVLSVDSWVPGCTRTSLSTRF
jgi:hypothetical protein